MLCVLKSPGSALMSHMYKSKEDKTSLYIQHEGCFLHFLFVVSVSLYHCAGEALPPPNIPYSIRPPPPTTPDQYLPMCYQWASVDSMK